jgi:hypothetical protein
MSWRKPTSFFAACITMPKATTGVKRPRDTNQVEDREPTPGEQGKDPAAVERGRPGPPARQSGLQSGSSMNLRRCEPPGDIARIAALSADQAPTAIIGCPHMTEPGRIIRPVNLVDTADSYWDF